jgi:hypothetical protein
MAENAVQLLGAGEYLSLTTYRRDGTPVPTPVWVVHEEGRLHVITDADSGKVKRLRHTARVEVAPCDMRGSVTGPAHPATAELLDAAGTERVMTLVSAKYGWKARAIGAMAAARGMVERARGRAPGPGRIGIRIELDPGSPD